MTTTWKEQLDGALAANRESWADVVSSTLTEKELSRPFDDSYGAVYGSPFTVWTANTVYFPICYDGAEWVGWVARNPNGKPTEHFGGG